MAWKIEFDSAARDELAALDRSVARRILDFLRQRLATGEDPRRLGKALRGARAGFWRYRVGDYRLICRIDDRASRILVQATAAGSTGKTLRKVGRGRKSRGEAHRAPSASGPV